jgi:adenylate cyclase class IV
MPRNIEIKARIERVDDIASQVAALATEGPFQLCQEDVFFQCGEGRLKLRTFSAGSGELIFYRRADAAGPKESFYVRSPTSDPAGLCVALTLAYGQVGRVRKRRTLYLAGRTRIHLDEVDGLGHFIELEVVLADGEAAAKGISEANELMRALGVQPGQRVEVAYVDLLAGGAEPTDSA